MFSGGAIYARNRYLRDEGDPAQRFLDDEGEHPAQRTVREALPAGQKLFVASFLFFGAACA